MDKQTMSDAEVIEALGGPAKLAWLLGYSTETGTQRVHNWKTRGIPVRVKFDRPDIFGKYQIKAA